MARVVTMVNSQILGGMPDTSKISLYHITSWRNIGGIMASDGLWCASERHKRSISPVSAAHPRLMERRSRTSIPVAPYGVLADYEPFAFWRRSPMLCAIANHKVPDVDQRDMVHLRVMFEDVQKAGLAWIFSDGHPIMELSQFYTREEDFQLLDWPLIHAKHWANTESDLDRLRRRQAEFLIHRFVPWNLISGIGVFDEEMRAQVEATMTGGTHQPPTRVLKDWYYE